MPLKWNQVAEKEEYLGLPDSEKAKVKVQYFQDVIAPNVPEPDVKTARTQFLNDVARKEIEQAKPSFLKEVVVKSLLKLPQRTAGMAIGASLSPLAFAYSSMAMTKESEFRELPFLKQAFVAGGKGINEALKTIFKEGHWGPVYKEYYKDVTGKSVEEDLPENFKWAAPTIEFIADLIVDPLITGGLAKNLARFKIPKGWIGKIPDRVLSQLKQIERLDQAEKVRLQEKLMESLKSRKDYMQWWEDRLDQFDLRPRGEPLLRGERDPYSKMTAPRQAMAGQPKERFARIDPDVSGIAKEPLRTKQELAKEAEIRSQETYRSQRAAMQFKKPSTGEPLLHDTQDIVKSDRSKALQNFGIKIEKRLEPELSETIRTTPKIGKKGVSPEAISATEKLNKLRAEKDLPPIQRVPIEEIKKVRRQQATTKIEAFRQKKGLPPLRKEQEPIEELTALARGAEETRPQQAISERIVSKAKEIEPGKDKLVSIRELRKQLPDIPKEEFDRAVLDIAEQEKAWLHKHGYPAMAEPDQIIREGEDAYMGLVLREAPKPKPASSQAVKKAISPIKLRAGGGATLGLETDDEGNLYYDVKKGALGAVAMAGGTKLVKHPLSKSRKAVQVLQNNPAWAKVAGAIKKEKQTYTLPDVFQKLNKTLFERFAVLKKASPETYKEARKFRSYINHTLIKFRPLVQAFDKVKKGNFAVTSYVKAHRDLTRAQRGIQNPGNVTLQDARQAIKEIENQWVSEGKNLDDLKNALDSFNEWTHEHILFDALESGFISEQAYDDIIQNNKWYAAYDVIEYLPENIDNIPLLRSKEWFSKANQDIIKGMKGTEKFIDDPIDATIRKFTRAQYNFAQNKVANTLIDDPNIQGIIRPIAKSKKEFSIMKNQGLAPVMQGAFNKKQFGTINRFKNGLVESYAVPKEIADSMKQMTPYQAPRLIKAYNQIFRATATTLSPAFMVRNAFRDAILAYISSPYYKVTTPHKFIADWGKGVSEAVKHELGKASLVDEYVEHGGLYLSGGAEAFQVPGQSAAKRMLFEKSLSRKAATVITSPLKLMEKVNTIIELAPRLGTFHRGMKLGFSMDDAALQARQATIDFDRGGTFFKTINQFVPFINARVQAKVTLYEAFRNNPKQTAAKMFSTVMVPGISAYAWNRLYYSDLYDDIPEYIRQSNFILIYGQTQDEKTGKIVPKYIAIPKGDAGTLVNPIEFGLDQAMKKDERGTKEFLINFASDISPIEFAREGKPSLSKAAGSLLPPIVQAPLEDWANLKFYYGNEIVPYWMEKTKPPELQYTETTPELYKWLGKKIGYPPLRLQNWSQNLFTTYGRVGFSPKAMMDTIRGSIVKKKGGEIQSQAFVALKNIETGYTTARAYAEELVKEGKRGAANDLINEWNRGLNQSISAFNKQFADKGYRDRGGIRRSYYFSMEKRRNLLMKRQEKPGQALEKRLRGPSMFSR